MCDSIRAMERLLDFRPKSICDPIPEDVYEARMSLLSKSDAERLKADFESGRDPVAIYLYFGGDLFGKCAENAAATMTRCAYVGVDRETTLRLFRASGWSDGVTEEKLPEMLKEAMEFVGEFREEMSKMNRCVPRAKPNAAKRRDDGKGGM